MKNIFDLLGRIFLATIFIYEAIDSIVFFGATKESMEEYNIIWNQDFLLSCCIILLLLGGTLLLLGYRSNLGAILLLTYWIPITFIVHSFWNDVEQFRRIESLIFMRNLAIIGGLFMVLANESGRYSVKRLFSTTKVRQRLD